MAQRTRSQLTLPDDMLLRIPQRSPMKDARDARRALPPQPQEQLMFPDPTNELRAKRSISPTPEAGTSTRYSEPPPERETKRAKKASDDLQDTGLAPHGKNDAPSRRVHSRNASDPNVSRTRRSTRKRSATPAESNKPAFSTGVVPSTESGLPPVNRRAQSVPLFPSSYSLPFIDLKNPPPSPRRTRSRSPEKEEPRLRITFKPTKLDGAMDESEERMDMEEAPHQDVIFPILDAHIIAAATTTTTTTTTTITTTTATNSPNLAPSKPPVPSQPYPSLVVNGEVPSTPAPSRTNLLVTLSPLTPLPETPIMSKETRDQVRSHPTQSGHAEDVGNADATTRDQTNLENHFSPSPVPQSIHHAQQSTPIMGPPLVPSGVGRSLLVVPGRKPSNSSSDAFSVMMQACQEKTKLPAFNKGKQRAGVGSTRSTSSSASTTSEKDLLNGRRHEGPGSLFNKLRSRMRPREKPKVEAVLNLSVPVETESETDDQAIPDQPEINHSQVSHSISPAERSSSSIPEPPVAEDKLQGAEIENDILKIAQHDDQQVGVTPAVTENLPLVLPEKDALHLVTGSSSSDAFPETALTDVIERVPSEINKTTQEQGPLTTESTEMVCDQPTESTIPEAGQHIDAAVTPTSIVRDGNKTRLGRRRAVATTVPVGRKTRSSVSRSKTKELTIARSALRSNIPITLRATRSRSASVASPYGKSEIIAQGKGAQRKSVLADDISLPPGLAVPSSPVRTPISSNYAKPTTSSAAKVTKTSIRTLRTSPAKLGRTSSLPGSRPASALSYVFPMSSADPEAPSSLSTLSIALEKLRMPPPSRPNTSMGFHDTPDETDNSISMVLDTGLGKDLPSTNTKLRRRSSSFGTSTAKPQSTTQQSLSKFLNPKQGPRPTNLNGLFKPEIKAPLRPKIFGVGSKGVFGIGMRSRAPKVSRKTSLPMVVGSPVKGGGPMEIQDNNDDYDASEGGINANDSLEIVMSRGPDAANLREDEYLVPIAGYSPKEAGKKDKDEGERWKTSSRRASLASLALSESLSALPLKGSMGPPPTIPKHGRVTRSTSGSYASANQPTTDEKVDGTVDPTSKPPSSTGSPLRFLKSCVVFVDVRTDEGDDAGSLFVEMLEGAGAKVLTRVGQTCTHIILKNGLLSTMTRYRSLRNPKPYIVGIGWVVECIEQRKHVDESKFLVDLSDLNTVSTNKRRRSMLPKLVSLDNTTQAVEHRPEEDGDRSLDGSNSSLILDDLPPLERARRRKSLLIGPRS